MNWFFLVGIFSAVAVSVVAGYFVVADLVRRDERRARQHVEEFRKGAATTAAPTVFKSDSEFNLGEFTRLQSAGPAPTIFALLRQRDWLRPLRDSLAQSGLPFHPRQVLAASAGLALVLGAVGLWVQGLLLGVPGLIVGSAGPLVYVKAKARARRERFLTQLGGAFELMARIIRSGQSIPQAFQAVGEACEEPVASAFARCHEHQNLGLSPEAALQELAEQSGVLEMRIFAMAMLIQRQVGGNLSEVLERLAGLVRERRRMRQQIRTLTAEGRLQATVLLVLPFFLFAVMRFVNRGYTDELLRHPSLLAATGVAMTIGALWIRKIIQFDA